MLGVHHQRQIIAAVEHGVLAVPQVRFPVDATQSARVDDGGTVVDRVTGGLGKAGDDGEPESVRKIGPFADGGPVPGFCQRRQLSAVGEDVTRRRQLRQHDDLRAVAGR